MALLGYCIESFQCALVRLINLAEQIQAGKKSRLFGKLVDCLFEKKLDCLVNLCGRYVQTSSTFVLWAAAHVVLCEA